MKQITSICSSQIVVSLGGADYCSNKFPNLINLLISLKCSAKIFLHFNHLTALHEHPYPILQFCTVLFFQYHQKEFPFLFLTPVYNFINDRLVDESAVLRPLSWHLILYVFRYFSRKWQKISDCECPDLIQNETSVRFLYGTQKNVRSDRAESILALPIRSRFGYSSTMDTRFCFV